MNTASIKQAIISGETILGVELGSTRIKMVLIDQQHTTIATGSYQWENQLVNGIWTYGITDIWTGLQQSYQQLAENVRTTYKVELMTIGTIGFSGMMHGYMAFNQQGELLVPFRTWRNAITADAEAELTRLFQYNIPQRWSIAQLYLAILNEEAHVAEIHFLTTLAGYVHWQLTGEKVLGIGDASGMFPIDPRTKNYDQNKVAQLAEILSAQHIPWQLEDLLPTVLMAGEEAGVLTVAGAKRLDPSGRLQPGIPFCPPEGDAGTGMVATNSVAPRTGNVSAGTSAFAMIVLEKPLTDVHSEIDLVTTPTGHLVGMVHTNNCTSEINAWIGIFREFADVIGASISDEELFSVLFHQALAGDDECGGLLSYGYHSGENITRIPEGRPLFVRSPESKFRLANFMRMHLFSAFGALKLGMDCLQQEHIQIDRIVAHGGIFKTPKVAQSILAAAVAAPVTVMETAGEGGAWGIAVLGAYSMLKQVDERLEDYLDRRVFNDAEGVTIEPALSSINGFKTFAQRYTQGLAIEEAAITHFI